MSTPEQPLTRKQLREFERTGAVPVQSAPSPVEDVASAPVAPLPRAAEPAAPQPAPVPDASVDLGSAPLTRRQARQQERIRTASVPVITPDVAAAHVVAAPETPDLIEGVPADDAFVSDSEVDAEPATRTPESDDATDTPDDHDADDAAADDMPDEPAADADASQEHDASEPLDEAAEHGADVVDDSADADEHASDDVFADLAAEDIAGDEPSDAASAVTDPAPARRDDEQWAEGAVIVADETPAGGDLAEDADPVDDEEPVEEYAPVSVGPQFGAALLAGEPEIAAVDLPPSFDELIARNASSATSSTPSALILSQSPTAPSLAGPITATGEVIITGSYRLPDGLGSSGVDPRSADGKDVDAVLIDGELPAASSPTPIAASAAISTVRGADEIIRPPAPEKGSKLILSLAITAGVLAVAVIAVLVVALTNGVFS